MLNRFIRLVGILCLIGCPPLSALSGAGPTITQQPLSQTVALGQTATFSVVASPSTGAQFFYQWRKNGIAIRSAGGTLGSANSASYTTPATIAGDTGSTFSVVVYSGTGSTISSNAILTVGPPPAPPTITAQPANMTVSEGQSANFSVTASGTPPLSFQWLKNGVAVSGGAISLPGPSSPASSGYGTPAASASDNGAIYSVVASDSSGRSVTSSAAILTVTPPPVSVRVSPASASLLWGAAQTFTGIVSGTPDTMVDWSATGGTLSATGDFTTTWTAPSATSGTYTVTAASHAYPTKVAYATITVSSPIHVAITPASVSLLWGAAQTLTATVSGTSNTAVDWSATGGTLSANTGGTTTWTAPSTSGTYTVTAASHAYPANVAYATITVSSPINVAITPSSASVLWGATQTLSATVTGDANTAVTWSASGGSLSATTGGAVTWTAPSTSGTYSVTATSQADPAKTSSATMTVGSAIQVSLNPAIATLNVSSALTLTATITGTANTGVNWSSSGGTLSATTGGAVTWTAPATTGTYTVRATSQADPLKSATATLTVTPAGAIIISVNPTAGFMAVGGAQTLTATVINTTSTSVTWTATGGTLSATTGGTVTWTAPQVVGVYVVTATSQADSTKTAVVTLRVSPSTCAP